MSPRGRASTRVLALVHLVGLSCACDTPAYVDVRMAGFDNTTGIVQFCGDSHAGLSDITHAARESCALDRKLDVLRCMSGTTGADASTLHLTGLSSTKVSSTYGMCCDFRCGPPPQPPAASGG